MQQRETMRVHQQAAQLETCMQQRDSLQRQEEKTRQAETSQDDNAVFNQQVEEQNVHVSDAVTRSTDMGRKRLCAERRDSSACGSSPRQQRRDEVCGEKEALRMKARSWCWNWRNSNLALPKKSTARPCPTLRQRPLQPRQASQLPQAPSVSMLPLHAQTHLHTCASKSYLNKRYYQ